MACRQFLSIRKKKRKHPRARLNSFFFFLVLTSWQRESLLGHPYFFISQLQPIGENKKLEGMSCITLSLLLFLLLLVKWKNSLSIPPLTLGRRRRRINKMKWHLMHSLATGRERAKEFRPAATLWWMVSCSNFPFLAVTFSESGWHFVERRNAAPWSIDLAYPLLLLLKEFHFETRIEKTIQPIKKIDA